MPNEDSNADSTLLRPNFKIISSLSAPVITTSQSTNNPSLAITQTDLAQAYTNKGNHFTANTGIATTVANNNYLVGQISVAANYGKNVYIDRLRVGSGGTSSVYIVTGTVTGTTAMNKYNTKINSANSSVSCGVVANPATAPTITNSIYVYLLMGGTTELHFNGRLIIPISSSAQSLLLCVQNTSNSNCMISVSWWEA